jgi:hypothetical protein
VWEDGEFRVGRYLIMGLLRVLRQAKWTDPGFFTRQRVEFRQI